MSHASAGKEGAHGGTRGSPGAQTRGSPVLSSPVLSSPVLSSPVISSGLVDIGRQQQIFTDLL
jgi:hypothetical protein